MSGLLTPARLDALAQDYYLRLDEIADLGPDELQQELSVALIADALGGSERVLEMGFGIGRTIHELRDRGLRHEIVEGSPLLVAEAAKRFPDLVVHEAMFEAFSPTEPFDAVLALHVLEHVDDPVAVLRRAGSWLRPGGRLVAAVPNAESLHRRMAVRMGMQQALDSRSERDELLGHQRVYTLDGLRADAEAAGFAVVDELGWFVKTLSNAQMADWSRELLEALFAVSQELPPRALANIAIVAEWKGAPCR